MILLKTVNELCPLQSGMCIEMFRENTVERGVLFKTGNNQLCLIDYDTKQSWSMIETLWLSEDSTYCADRVKVYNSPTGMSIFEKGDMIFDSEKSKIELTLEDIAKKYGVKPENITIKYQNT